MFRVEKGKKLYLVLTYPSGHFDFAKGHVEEGEGEHETAFRELVEETGIEDLKFIEGYREEIAYTYKKKGKRSNKLVVFFLGKTETAEVKISHEHRGHFWLPYEEAFNKVTFENAKNLLEKAKKLLGGE